MKYYNDVDQKDDFLSCSIYSYLKQTADQHPNELALNYYGKKENFSWLMGEIDRVANAFTALGIKKGDIVSFVAVAVPQVISAIYALSKIGAAANLIDPRMDVEFITRMIQNANSKILICVDAVFSKAHEAAKTAGIEKIYVAKVGDYMPGLKKFLINRKLRKFVTYGVNIFQWSELLALSEQATATLVEDAGPLLAAISYTGGTTGFPKGVMFSNDSLNAVAFNFSKSIKYAECGQTFLGIIPVFTSYGLACGMHMPLCMGVGLIPIPQFKPKKFGKLVREFRPNHMVSTPAFYEMLMKSRAVRGMNLSFLLTLGSGGDTMNEGLEQKLNKFIKKRKIKYPLAQGYGLSEMSSAVTFMAGGLYKKGSVGIPSITTNVGIFDPETGKELPLGEKGEVCVTGPNMMMGYFHNEEETAHVMRLHDDGKYWIHSGDLGYLDEDGFLYIVGRFKRMITRFDGHKVFPVQLESLVSAREDVQNCCVVGVKDRSHSQGEYPLVIVTLYGHDDESFKQRCKEIYNYCQEVVEERGRPVAVKSVKEIPLTLMGKNDYRAMDKKFKNFDYVKWQKKNLK